MKVHIPIRTVSEANARDHWTKKKSRTSEQRGLARVFCRDAKRLKVALPLTITLTRVSPTGKTLDDDNLASALKATRDGVADALGIDDGDKRLTWVCQQRRGDCWGVDVAITRSEQT